MINLYYAKYSRIGNIHQHNNYKRRFSITEKYHLDELSNGIIITN